MNKYQEEFDLVRRLCSLDGRELTILNYGIEEGRNKAIDEFLEKATKIVYEANDRKRNPQPRDMVADIHYKLLELKKEMIKEV